MKPAKAAAKLVTSLWVVAILVPTMATAQETADYFRANCISCHTIGGGRLVGPDLKDVSARADHDWLVDFILNPKGVLDAGDPYALKLKDEAAGALMPNLADMTRDRAERLMELIIAESLLEESQFAGLSIGDEPFTQADIDRGHRLFTGVQALENGAPSCLACHTSKAIGGLGGGRLGPDLTRVYERLQGRKNLAAWLQAPATEVMRPIFRQASLTNDEIKALVAYLEDQAQAGGEASQTFQTVLLVFGLLGVALAFFLADAVWKGRFRGVRIPLIEGEVRAER